MFVGDKNRINVSSSRFSDFIANNNLYVDKTAFIEHVLQDASTVLLFTRPRRMGKSLNMDTLATFLDCMKSTARLFKGLYVETSPVFGQINQYPVVYLDFVNLDSSNLEGLRRSFRRQIREIIGKFFNPSEIKNNLKEYVDNPFDYSPDILGVLLKAVADHYQKEPFFIVDEYDKVIMDTLNHPEGDAIKNFIVNALQGALKGQTHFAKAVLTGVTRTTKESLFSTLNNLEVYDILHSSAYDADFSLTETELTELIPENEINGVRKWYNNMRVGDELLYNIYSVMSYLNKPKAGLKGYWSMTGGGNLLSSLLVGKRAEVIANMLNDNSYRCNTALDYQVNMEHLKNGANCSDISFYTIAVQAGYLTFEQVNSCLYEVFIPNEEAKRVWARLFLDTQYKDPIPKIIGIFGNIADTKQFSEQLTDFASMALSYHDIVKDEAERLYHVFFFALLYMMGYDCQSNREAGLGRADILLRTPQYNAIFEFKTSGSPKDEALQKEAEEAIRQIDGQEYWHEVKDSPLPLYKIGIACHGKKCFVKTILHSSMI
ncbi:MAG: ATP-binding protein [Oscillospiraceae bacterium]|nr:ATP-binding protein [Oscillospiraceae bacterium]